MDTIQMFKPGRYNSYDKKPELIEPIFTLFQIETDDYSVMREVSVGSRVPLTMLHSWREKVGTKPS
jgi:hypothetical protein